MSNFKFNIDPKDPQEEQIARHKDFGKVLHNYQRMTNPLYRTPLYVYRKVFLAVIFILALAWMVVEFGEHQTEKKNISKDSIHKADSLKKDSQKLKSILKGNG